MNTKRDPVWDATLKEFCGALAGSQPVPAGVAAAIVTGTMGLALLHKVFGISSRKHPDHDRFAEQAWKLAELLCPFPKEDTANVERYRKASSSEKLRLGARTISIPLKAAKLVLDGLDVSNSAAVEGWMHADQTAGARLLQTSAEILLDCAVANLEALPLSPSTAKKFTREAESLRERFLVIEWSRHREDYS